MIKKLLIAVIVALVVAFFFTPEITWAVAKKAFAAENVNKEWAPTWAYRSGVINMRFWRYKAGGDILTQCYNQKEWQQQPWHATCFYQIAVCYEKTGDTQRATAGYKAFIQQYPKDPLKEAAEKAIARMEANK